MSDLREQVNSKKWFHSIDFGNGIVSPGAKSLEVLNAEANIYFSSGIAGRSFLDIGCWDGSNSIQAARRGAARVLATDHYVWHHGAGRENFELARAHIAPRIEVMDIDLPDLTPERVGQFDMVLFAGVLYHLRHPLLGLEQAARLTKSELVVETHMDAADIARPAMVFYPGAELSGDPSNWWGPNRACVEAMLRDVGFASVRYTAHPSGPSRGIYHAIRA